MHLSSLSSRKQPRWRARGISPGGLRLSAVGRDRVPQITNPKLLPFTSQRLPRYLSQSETLQFFAVIASTRDRALFSLIYHHGLRVGEVALFSRSDVDLDRGRVLVRRLKGG